MRETSISFTTAYTSTLGRLVRRSVPVGAAALVPALLSTTALSDSLPEGCTPDASVAGGSATCVVPAPETLGPIVSTVGDFSLTVGSADAPTVLINPLSLDSPNIFEGTGIDLSGGGSQTINILNAGSSVTAGRTGIRAHATDGDVNILSEGTVFATVTGIDARSGTNGAANITVNNITATNEFSPVGIQSSGRGTGSAITLNGQVSGFQTGVRADQGPNGVLTFESVGQSAFGSMSLLGLGGVEATFTGDVDTDGGFRILSQNGQAVSVRSVADASARPGPLIELRNTGGDGIDFHVAGDLIANGDNLPSLTKLAAQVVNSGGGAIRFQVDGTVEGEGGVAVIQEAGGDSVTASLGSVTSTNGTTVYAFQGGGGGLTIESTGALRNEFPDADFEPEFPEDAPISSPDTILALQTGSGPLTIDVGDVFSVGRSGVVAQTQDQTGSDVSIRTGNIDAAQNGVEFIPANARMGNVEIATGDVTAGNIAVSLFTVNSSAEGETTITTGNLNAQNFGVRASTSGQGSVTITVNDVKAETGVSVLGDSVGGSRVFVNGDVLAHTGIQANNTGGGVNIVTVNEGGSVTAMDAGDAVLGGTGREEIENLGLIRGNIDLGAGIDRIENSEGGRIVTGNRINLGGESPLEAFENRGTLLVGNASPGESTDTTLTGTFNQAATGLTLMNFDTLGGVDRLMISGAASLDGSLQVAIDASTRLAIGASFDLLVAGDGLTLGQGFLFQAFSVDLENSTDIAPFSFNRGLDITDFFSLALFGGDTLRLTVLDNDFPIGPAIDLPTNGVQPVPIPAAGWLLAAGLGMLGLKGMRKRNTRA